MVKSLIDSVEYIGIHLDIKTLKLIDPSKFESHLSYTSLLWAQNSSSVERPHIPQKKSLRLVFFKIKPLTQFLFLKTENFKI